MMLRAMRHLSAGSPAFILAAAAAVVLISCAAGRDADVAGGDEVPGWRDFFPAGSTARPVSGLSSGEEAYEVTAKGGALLGWFFRTDRVDPEVKGLVGQLGVLVAVSSSKRIIGVRLLEHGDAPSYVDKLTEGFYGQFRGRSVYDAWEGIDAVTGATLSSSGVARDVFLSCRRLFSVVAAGK